MADLQTIAEKCELKDAVIAYLGDGNNMANSLILGASVLGLELRLATPASHRPALRTRRKSDELAAASGAKISWSEDPAEAVRGANFVYTDTWTSMGQEDEQELRKKIFHAYQLNAELLAQSENAYAMHCLPAHRGEEITDEVLDGDRSLALVQAENRLHAQKAILEQLLGSAR
jgi:ornithine carbamoyltransferase